MTGVFQSYAQYYDLLYADKNYEAEAEYIFQLIKKYNPKTKAILNLGCGTGKHDIVLKKKGLNITGIDFSNDMVSRAKQQSTNIEFIVGDIRTIRLGKKFDAVISLFHVACYQNSNDDLNSYFQTANKHLLKNGIFIFDVWHGPAVLADLPIEKNKEVENKNIIVKRKTIPNILKNNNIVEVNFYVEITDKQSGEKKKLHEVHRMRYLFPDEIKKNLSQAKFKLLASEQWMTGKTPSDKTWYVTYIAKKIE